MIRTRKLSVYGRRNTDERQKFITDFYKQYNDTKAFEADILERNATPEQRERQVDIADLLLEEMLKEK